MRLRFTAVLAVAMSVLGAGGAAAQQRSLTLVCFGKDGLGDSLRRVVNPQQFLGNDRVLKSRRYD